MEQHPQVDGLASQHTGHVHPADDRRPGLPGHPLALLVDVLLRHVHVPRPLLPGLGPLQGLAVEEEEGIELCGPWGGSSQCLLALVKHCHLHILT